MFVYGTLKRGFANHSLLDDATFLGRFRSIVPYPLVVGGAFFSPYLLDIPGKGERVFGEVYTVSSDTLARLDVLENVGVNYARSTMVVASTYDPSFTATTFVYLKRNFGDDLLKKPMMADYQCRKYIPRHRRPRSPEKAVSAGVGCCSHAQPKVISLESVISCCAVGATGDVGSGIETPLDMSSEGRKARFESDSSMSSSGGDEVGSPVSCEVVEQNHPLLSAFTNNKATESPSRSSRVVPAFVEHVGASMYAGASPLLVSLRHRK